LFLFSFYDGSTGSLLNWKKTAANKLKGPANVERSLGEMLKQFLDSESEEERILLNWHVANLEYACAIDLNLVSLNEWDQDDGYEFVGEHFLVNDVSKHHTHISGVADLFFCSKGICFDTRRNGEESQFRCAIQQNSKECFLCQSRRQSRNRFVHSPPSIAPYLYNFRI